MATAPAQFPPVLPRLNDDQLPDPSRNVFDDIRATRNTGFVNNIWRALASNPDLLASTWADVKSALNPDGALDLLTKQLIYIAVSVAHGCDYCVRSHVAAARNLGATDAQIAELYKVIGVASKTNRLAGGLQVPIDDVYASTNPHV